MSETISRTIAPRSKWPAIVVCAVLVAVAAAFGARYLPGPWYETLARPSWTPPNWVFGPVWTLLYVMIAAAGVVAWRKRAGAGVMSLWLLQLGANALWSYLFFGLHRPGSALADIIATIALVALFIAAAWKRERYAALLMLPYLCWIVYAASLNAGIVYLNR